MIKPPRALIEFDASNDLHRKIYSEYRAAKKWGVSGCPFKLKWPFLSIPAMCESMIMDFYTDRELTNV